MIDRVRCKSFVLTYAPGARTIESALESAQRERARARVLFELIALVIQTTETSDNTTVSCVLRR